MFSTAIHTKTREVLKKLYDIGIINDFYLAGGTALAIHLGHRVSIDLDFFTNNFPKIDILKSRLKDLNIEIINENYNTLDLNIDGIKVSFLEYKYPMLEEYEYFDNVKMASIIDIACMKISAISSRGTKKDFVDIYFILKIISLDSIIDSFKKKYIGINYSLKHIYRSLTYFEDADKYPDIVYLENMSIDWKDIKEEIKRKVLISIQ